MISVIRKAMSVLRSKQARILLKLYEPFVCSLCLSILSITFSIDYFQNGAFISQEDYDKRAMLLSLIGGYSLIGILRMLSCSSGLCFWYMTNLVCLLINNIAGFLFYFGVFSSVVYMFMATGLSCIGVISFLIFKIFYRISSEVDCHHIQ